MKGVVGKRYQFEGKELTLKEIQAIIPFLSVRAIGKHLKAGRNTRHAFTTFDHTSKLRAGGRAAKAKRRNFTI